ncbi:MAG: FtsX-like permease family protein [Bradymonadia bacterium]
MSPGRLLSLVGQNIKRSRKNFLMSGIGIVVGVATFVFFMGLGEGIKNVVLGRIFLIDQVEVVKKTFDTGIIQTDSIMGFGASKSLNDDLVEAFKEIPGIKGVYPKMKFTFPTTGWGGKSIVGKDIRTVIFADGLDPELVKDELSDPNVFVDYDAPRSCSSDNDCYPHQQCAEQKCEKRACDHTLSKKERTEACPGKSYCPRDTDQCEMPIPAIVSNGLLEIVNGSLRTAMTTKRRKIPRISPKVLTNLSGHLGLGKSYLGRADRKKPLTRRANLVGLSDRAIDLGLTIPIGYVKRLNARFSGAKAGNEYHSILIQVKDQTQVPAITNKVREMGYDIADKTENAERAADIIRTIEGVFGLVSVVIIGIAAINISQMFFMIIYQRKREIGLLRALGAGRGDIRNIILSEAAIIGLFAGAIGAATGYGLARLADFVAGKLPDFPFKPDTFFEFPLWVWFAALGGAMLFCLFGAFFPARAAARQEPAAALTQ